MHIRPVRGLAHVLKLLKFLMYLTKADLATLWRCGFLKASPWMNALS